MNIARSFVKFWYDFIVGDAWEIATAVVVALVICAALASTALQPILWLVLPLIIGLSLVGSLIWQVRKQRH